MTYQQLRPILISRWNSMAEAAGPNWEGSIPVEREELDCLIEEFDMLRGLLANWLPRFAHVELKRESVSDLVK